MRIHSFCLFLFLAITVVSCKDEAPVCTQSTDVNVKNAFYKKVSGVESAALATNFSLRQVGYADSLYKNTDNVSGFSIPLNPLLDSQKFIVSISKTLPPDTVTYFYSSTKMTISPECGDVFLNTLSKVSTTVHTLDSAKIINNTVNLTSGQNVKLYVR